MNWLVGRRFVLMWLLAIGVILIVLPVSALPTQPPTGDDMTALVWNPAGDRLASGHHDGSIHIWNAATEENLNTFQGGTSAVISLAWSPDGSRLASSSYDSTIKIWTINTGQSVTIPVAADDPVFSLAWNADGSQLIGGSGGFTSPQTFRFWDGTTGDLIKTHLNMGVPSSLALKPDGLQMVLGKDTGNVYIWDMASERITASSRLPFSLTIPEMIWSMTWSPDENRLATGQQNGMVRLWDTSSGSSITLLDEFPASDNQSGDYNISTVRALAFSPDGQRLSSISANGAIRAWNLLTGEVIAETQVPAPVYAASWSPDGTKLAYGGRGNRIHLIENP